VDTRFIDVDPIPFEFAGTSVTLRGEDFPDIIPFLGDDPPADMIINGDLPNNAGTGTYDPATGRLEVSGLKFLVRLYPAGDAGGAELGSFDSIPPVTFTTDVGQKATGNGPTPEITVDGQHYNSSDGSITIVMALTIPNTLGSLKPIDDAIGGGALTAVFKGSLDQNPANCEDGGGGGPTTGTPLPGDIAVSVDDKAKVSQIDFGSTLALVSEGRLDCTEAGNRGAVTKMVTIKNTGSGDRKIRLLKSSDTDGDLKQPLCSGTSEFVRGTVTPHGGAVCQSVTVAGKSFTTDECTIPSGGDDTRITFPLIYMPFNFIPSNAPAVAQPTPSPGATPVPSSAPSASVVDTGTLLIEYDDDKSFAVGLKGITEPDSRNALSVSKVVNDVVSQKEITDGQLLKIALSNTDPTPFTQNFVLKNKSGDSWENVALALSGEATAFSIVPPAATTLGPQASADNPGTLGFGIAFNPSGGASAFEDTLTITLNKAGSTAVTTLVYTLQGTVGIDPILGEYQLKIDFMTSFIDNSLISAPIESLDFRDPRFTDQAAASQVLSFGAVNAAELQPVDLLPDPFDPLHSTVSERRTALRILNAQGSGLKPGDDSSLCQEPDPINASYQEGDCAYFYFNLNTGDNSQGLYDEETGNLTMPNLDVQVINPYHGVVGGGVWPATDGTNNILDTNFSMSLTTLVLDDLRNRDGLPLVADGSIGRAQLNVAPKDSRLGPDCTADAVKSREHPHFRCYLTGDGKFLQGRPVALREGETSVYDVILVGVGKFNAQAVEGDIPVFMSNSLMYLVIQGRLCPAGSDCTFSQ
jgi:hypothetical protein